MRRKACSINHVLSEGFLGCHPQLQTSRISFTAPALKDIEVKLGRAAAPMAVP